MMNQVGDKSVPGDPSACFGKVDTDADGDTVLMDPTPACAAGPAADGDSKGSGTNGSGELDPQWRKQGGLPGGYGRPSAAAVAPG